MVKLKICPRCEGRGKHTNPNIDGHGLSREDFDNDPQFEEDYFAGVYDVKCHKCKGEKVIPAIENPCEECGQEQYVVNWKEFHDGPVWTDFYCENKDCEMYERR
jgi:RecJ-like exonuclease